MRGIFGAEPSAQKLMRQTIVNLIRLQSLELSG